MIDLIGKVINDAARFAMGTPQMPQKPQMNNTQVNNIHKSQQAPCSTCGQNTLSKNIVPPQNYSNVPNSNMPIQSTPYIPHEEPQSGSGVLFNAEKSNTAAVRRLNPEFEKNLRNHPYKNTTGVTFN